MATKEMERKALAQIRKIVEELGQDSYIGTAFKGCFEDAENNIENDWAMSMSDRTEALEKKLNALTDKYEGLEMINENLKRNYEEMNKQVQEQANRAAKAEDKCEEQSKEINELNREIMRNVDELDRQDVEIMKLKAKLYDMMMEGKE